ncbi:MAG: nitroreductase family protein [Proteobacteria bacterium]|nr:nitroreductase family protein [Pseudomonadota bacterium]
MKSFIEKHKLPERRFSEALVERRATPNFDGSPIPENILAAIIKAGLEAPSGYNLQPWRLVVVRQPEQKRKLREAVMNQPKVEEAGAVIVCCGDLKATQGKSLEAVMSESAKYGFSEAQNNSAKATVEKIFTTPPGSAMALAPDYAVWLNRHVMIAFSTMMWMAEVLGYDTAPMEGFYEHKVKTVLKVPDDVRVVAILGIGKRKGPDKPYAGRRKTEDICYAEYWDEQLRIE